MELVYPMVISAIAVLITLIYASYLDIRDRRVPFINWLPMLAVGICCTGFILWQNTTSASFVIGYLALVVTFLYDDYLGNRGRTDLSFLIGYYQKRNLIFYLAIVLLLPILSWFILAPAFNIQLVPWYALYAGLFCYVSWLVSTGKLDESTKLTKTSRESINAERIARWYYVVIIMVFAITSIIMLPQSTGWGSPAILILTLSIFCAFFYLLTQMNLFGGADASALILISFAVPFFPINPLLGIPPLGFLAFSTLINALLLNLVAPIGIFFINIIKGNRAPLKYLFLGFPVSGDKIQDAWGFIMEDIEETDGKLSRKFFGFWDMVRRMYNDNRIYTKNLREHPEKYEKEMAIYRKAGTVWISYAVPFIIPITAGFVTAIIFGDFLFTAMSMIAGR